MARFEYRYGGFEGCGCRAITFAYIKKPHVIEGQSNFPRQGKYRLPRPTGLASFMQ
jgi:hypothetical protein